MTFDPNSLTDLQTLRDELANDPEGLGYENGLNNDSDAAILEVTVSAGSIDYFAVPLLG